MNKTLAFVGFLAGMSGASGMEEGLQKANISYDRETRTVVCRYAKAEELEKWEGCLSAALNAEFYDCDLSGGVDCTNASSLIFRNCKCIKTLDDVFDYVELYYHLWDATIIIDEKVIHG